MRLNRTSEWNVMAIWISRELPLFNFERLDILCAGIGDPSEKLWPFEFLESFPCSFSSVSIYHGPHTYSWVKSFGRSNLPRASVFNFQRLDILCTSIGNPTEMFWPFEFLESLRCSFSSISICHSFHTYTRVKISGRLNFWELPCSISRVSIYYAHELTSE